MNNEKSMGKRIKELLARKTLPTVLAGSMIFGSGALLEEVNAYSLDEPIQGYEDFINYNGIKVFINGRYVEFNESTGYPFVMNGSTMIPLRAVSEAFGAKVTWNEYSKTASVSKYDVNVDITVDSKEMKVKDLNDNSISIENVTKEAMVKDGRTYIPLRSLFECFGLSVRWDNDKKTAHIETMNLENLEYIDFKEEKVYSINELIEMNDVNKLIYDGEIINKEYLNILKESNQYVVVVKDNVAQIFSYQFLSELNYIYSFNNRMINSVNNGEALKFVLRDATVEDKDFLEDLYERTMSKFNLYVSSQSGEELRKDYTFEPYAIQNNHQLMLDEVRKIVESARINKKSVKEQVNEAIRILNTTVSYDLSGSGRNDVYGALIFKSTRCTGYAHAMNAILWEMGIPNIYVFGELKGGTIGHAWNLVYIDGEWYICDATNKSDLVDGNNRNYDYGENEDVELIKLTYSFNK